MTGKDPAEPVEEREKTEDELLQLAIDNSTAEVGITYSIYFVIGGQNFLH